MTSAPAEAAVHIHASAVAVDASERLGGGALAGVLIRGASGSGKSTFALRLIALGARLIADDVATLTRTQNGVDLGAPQRLFGCVEARGVGLLRLPALASAPLAWVVDLVPQRRADAPRLPDRRFVNFFGVAFPVLELVESDRAAAIVYCLARNFGEVLPGSALTPETRRPHER